MDSVLHYTEFYLFGFHSKEQNFVQENDVIALGCDQ